jgi:hypothetical protein
MITQATAPRRGDRRTALGLALLSAAALSFEISLTRLFAVQQFHHFAFMVISLAVMASAASGLLLVLHPRHPPLWALAAGFSASIASAYATINVLPFDSYAIAWDGRQIGVLLLYFLVAGAPFLLSGWATGVCLVAAGPRAQQPYAVNLAGSALGCLAAPALLATVGGEGSLLGALALGLLAATAFSPRRTFLQGTLGLLTLLAGVLALQPPESFRLTLSPYKPLASSLEAIDARHTLTRWTAWSRVDVVESPSLHVFPGLSLNTRGSLPEEAAVFLDGEGPLVIARLRVQDPEAARLAAHMPPSLAYELRPGARTLVLLPGAGFDAQLALASGASDVTIAFDDPAVHAILAGPYADYSHRLLDRPEVLALTLPARRALRAQDTRYNIVLFSLSDAFRPVTSGAYSLTESYPWTVEALADALHCLSPNGLLVITRWLGTPPAEAPRAWATLLAAMRQEGISDPGPHLIAFRSMRTATLIASQLPLTDGDLDMARSFMERNAFDPIYLPGLQPEETNRFNVLPEDPYPALFQSLLGHPAETIQQYAFDLRPPTDDRPFFFHFFRWGQTPEILRTLGQTWEPFGGSGYLVLLGLLIVMLILAVPLVLAPLLLTRRKASRAPGSPAQIVYFACLGAGFIFVELSILQRLTLLLDRPAAALSTVLFVLLLSSGMGSLLSSRMNLRTGLAGLCVVLAATSATMPAAVTEGLGCTTVPRLALAASLVLPAGVLMGAPFPSGLRRLELTSPGAIPWAWAVNGAVSGVAGVVATIALVSYGATATLLIGTVFYAGAFVTARRLPSASPR